MKALIEPLPEVGQALPAAAGDPAGRRSPHRRRMRRERRGAVVVLTAFLMVALLGLVALVVDLGYLMLAQTQLQEAADSAALAGSAVLAQGPAAARAEAQRFASLNMVGKTPVNIDPIHDVVLGHWDSVAHSFVPLTGADESLADSIQVTCRLEHSGGSPLFFSSLWGTQTANPAAVSLAQSQCTQCGPFIGVNEVLMLGDARTDSYNSWAGPYSAATAGAQGSICSNGPIGLVGNVAVHGDAHPGLGQAVSKVGHASITGSTAPRTSAMQLPPVNFGTAAMLNDNQNIPMTLLGKNPLDGQGSLTLKAHDTLALPPGTYYFSSVKLVGSSSLQTSGPTTIYCTGSFDCGGGSLVNATQLPRNLQVYCTGPLCTLSGNSDFYGTIYGPSTRLVILGTADFYGTLVSSDLVVIGNPRLHADQSLGPLQGCVPFPRIVN
ncbi:MAG TPA: Tad domain-containing protein [Pirellulales bacterium]|nr:Tad domain-containing protein [Pirellulales bacterium]